MKITSVNNDLIKETSKLLKTKYRNESGLFLLEGQKCIEEALQDGLEVQHIFSVSGFENYPQRIEVTESVISKISDAKSPPKAVAVAKQLKPKWSDKYNKVILLEGIKDTGNLGTIIRTAAAFDIDAIILYGDTVDLYNPKTVRSAVGNLWKIPIFNFDNLAKFKDYEKIATLPKNESKNNIQLKNYTPAKKVLIMFGSEAEGLSEHLKESANKSLTIEMSKRVESLNLSISVAITTYMLFNNN